MRATTLPRFVAGYFALSNLTLGVYALSAPKHYYDNFPLGQNWVAGDGVYNEHLMRDYGALNLALGAVALCAVIWATRELFIATAISQIAYAVPHIIYHLAHPDKVGDTTDQFGAIGGLSLGVVLAVLLLFYERKPSARMPTATPASQNPS